MGLGQGIGVGGGDVASSWSSTKFTLLVTGCSRLALPRRCRLYICVFRSLRILYVGHTKRVTDVRHTSLETPRQCYHVLYITCLSTPCYDDAMHVQR